MNLHLNHYKRPIFILLYSQYQWYDVWLLNNETFILKTFYLHFLIIKHVSPFIYYPLSLIHRSIRVFHWRINVENCFLVMSLIPLFFIFFFYRFDWFRMCFFYALSKFEKNQKSHGARSGVNGEERGVL